MKNLIRLFLAFGVCAPLYASESKPKPNVLLISLDDLNDWIEPLGGRAVGGDAVLAIVGRNSFRHFGPR
jgi:hypothetical protein